MPDVATLSADEPLIDEHMMNEQTNFTVDEIRSERANFVYPFERADERISVLLTEIERMEEIIHTHDLTNLAERDDEIDRLKRYYTRQGEMVDSLERDIDALREQLADRDTEIKRQQALRLIYIEDTAETSDA